MVAFNAERRMTLISTAFFIAMSFGFLGFALFLINAKGELEGEGAVGEYKVKIAKISPGIFAMLCATVIIVCCAQFRIQYSTQAIPYSTIPSQFGYDSIRKDSSAHVPTSAVPAQYLTQGYLDARKQLFAAQELYKLSSDKSARSEIIRQSKKMAAFLEQVIAEDKSLTQLRLLELNYETGLLYYDAGDCEKAEIYLSQASNSKLCTLHHLPNKPITYAEALANISSNDYCAVSSNEIMKADFVVLATKYDGKEYMDYETKPDSSAPQMLSTLEKQPYFSFEIDGLHQRIFRIADSAAALRYFGDMAGPGAAVRFHAPFMLININSPNVVEIAAGCNSNKQPFLSSPKYVDARPGELDIIDRSMKNPLFTNLNSAYIVPVYFFNSDYSREGYDSFLAFCQKIHFRSPGQRMGYRNPYDNSLVVWLSSGNGTFAHELAHELIQFDNPSVPHWLNEGIAAMQEEKNKDDYLDNWRLAYINAYEKKFNAHLPIEQVIIPYANDALANLLHDCYARYFCIFLNSHGWLTPLYQHLRGGANSLNSQASVLTMISGKDMAALNNEFSVFLAGRHLPESWDRSMYLDKVKQNVDGLPAH